MNNHSKLRSESTLTILVTGAAGFLGFHTCKMLLDKGYQVIGVDYMLPESVLKQARLRELGVELTYESTMRIREVVNKNFTFFKANIQNEDFWGVIKEKFIVDQVIHLTIPEVQAEHFDSLKNFALEQFQGFMQVLDFCVAASVKRLLYAHTLGLISPNAFYSWDKIYTLNQSIEWMNDHWAKVYRELHQLNSLALEFPKVYGPWQSLCSYWQEDLTGILSEQKGDVFYAHVLGIMGPLIQLIRDPQPNFSQGGYPLGNECWHSLEELQDIMEEVTTEGTSIR